MAILHVALASDWASAVSVGSYRVSTRGATLDEVGFIHCSTADQVAGVAEFVFAGVTDELVVLVLSPEAIAAAGVALRYEDGGDGRLFPHLYGPIVPSFVSAVVPARFEGDRFVVELPGETDAAASVDPSGS